MRILLLNPTRSSVTDILESKPTFPRIGLASIAASLQEDGHHIRILDPLIEGLTLKKLVDQCVDFGPDILGVSAYTEEAIDAYKLVTAAKRALDSCLIVMGGPHASSIPERTLIECKELDVVVVGEGERTMRDLSKAVDKGTSLEDVKGIYFREKESLSKTPDRDLIKDLDSLPFPAWHLFDLKKYSGYSPAGFKHKEEGLLELPVEGARGCPFPCTFCYRLLGRRVRYKSPKRIADEVERDVNEFGAKIIEFVEGTFGVNRKQALETCDELSSRGLNKKIMWETGCRVDTVDLELLRKMKEAGCHHISYGVESGNEEILKKCGKNTTLQQIKGAFRWTREARILAEATFILGLPYETTRTINDTINFAIELGPSTPNFAILVPFPGTDVARMAKEGIGGLRLLSEDWSKYGKQAGETLELVNVSRRKLKWLQRKAYMKFYMRPKTLRSEGRIVAVRGLRFAKDFISRKLKRLTPGQE